MDDHREPGRSSRIQPEISGQLEPLGHTKESQLLGIRMKPSGVAKAAERPLEGALAYAQKLQVLTF